jgi:hypothetical protein
MSATPPPVRYTTTISVDKTVAEIQGMLGKHGASRIAVDYQDGTPSGLHFALTTKYGVRLYELPVDTEAMHALLRRTAPRGKLQSVEQAERVAWRVVQSWLAAQLALIASQMVQLDEVMLPYMRIDNTGRTLMDAYRETDGHLELEARR